MCDRCQMPLVYRHLWAIGETVAQIPVDTVIQERYLVKAPHIWLDTKPGMLADVPDILPHRLLPYLHLYPHRLHIPEPYSFFAYTDEEAVLLLDNVPIDATGQLLATLESAWATVTPVRQVYWLWQILQLWKAMKGQHVATSLLTPDNIHVEGWRVRLRELIPDFEESDEIGDTDIPTTLPPGSIPPSPEPTETRRSGFKTLRDLADVWQPWIEEAHSSIRLTLQTICQQMQTVEENDTELKAIASHLNRLLLEQAAELPLKVDIVGGTTTGPQRTHNEDACYPDSSAQIQPDDALSPHLSIICDGIGGHEGGEVASQRALADLKLLLKNLVSEFQDRTDLAFPLEVEQVLQHLVRIVNNTISAQNDEQGRELRQRMGTTLVMAFQLPQMVETPSGMPKNSHELYLGNVGDSRAYWITPRYCHQLTVDDDVATREVRLGRSIYQEALERPDGGALTQALGTRDADALTPTVQRFILEESGLLLLCSDGLSDNNRVEQAWEEPTRAVFKGRMSLEDAVQYWIDLANALNGHDNTSVVLMRVQVGDAPKLPDTETTTQAPPKEPEPIAPPEFDTPSEPPPASDSELTEASKALLYDEENEVPGTTPFVSVGEPQAAQTTPPLWLRLLGVMLVAFFAGAVAFFISMTIQNGGGSNSEQTPTSSPTSVPNKSPGN